MSAGGSSVNVNFRVSGGEVQSYMDRIQQKSTDLMRGMLRASSQETDVAKEQLRSYQQQLAVLERKLRTESELSRVAAQMNRDSRLTTLREDIGNKYSRLDANLSSGEITRRQHRLGVSQLDSEEQRGTTDIEDQYRQELSNAKDQQRDNAILIRTMRENVDTVKSTSQSELNQMRKGDESLIDAVKDDSDPNALLANRLASQQFIEEQAKNNDKDEDKESVFNALLKSQAINRAGQLVSQMPSVESPLDLIKPMTAMMGMLAGGLTGLIAEAVTVGQIEFTGAGMELGERAGEFFGSALERTFKGRDELTNANYRLQGLTGANLGISGIGGAEGLGGTGLASVTKDLSQYGADFKQTSELQYKLATAQGTSRDLNKGAENMLALQQGFGIGQETFLSLTELLRSSKEQNRDVMRLVGGVASAGKGNVFANDRTFLGEFMQKNFTTLQKTLLSTQNEVASGTTFDILKRFDAVGGPFSARDSRSGGLISTIQNSLSNPGSDNLKALSFIGLRQQNPNMSFERLLEEQQKGLASPTYLKTMLGMVDRLGGDKSMRVMNTAQMLGLGGNLAAARKLYENREELTSGKISTAELMGTGEYSQGAIRQLGKDQTSVYTQATARIQNKFIEGAIEGLDAVKDEMVKLFSNMMSGLAHYVDKEIGQLTNGNNPKKNTTYNGKNDPVTRGAFNSKGQAQADRTRGPGGGI